MTTTIITVNAIYDEESGALTLAPPEISLGGGEQVHWRFHNVPPGGQPFIFFPDHPLDLPRQPFGPFQYLEPSIHGVLGIGNSGRHRDYPYTAMILNLQGPLASATGLIQNPMALENTSPDALIRYNPQATHPFKVMPQRLTLEKKRTAIWYIEGIPEGHFVTFQFDDFPEHPMRGPFLSFSFSRGFGNSWLANGAGFLFNEPNTFLNPINYRVALRNAQGIVVHWDDPVIEPLESPPPPSEA
ncbi:MAG TPA: hypothetical protein VJ885_03550 [Thermoanaerobaculia bacterium]|nr:hypothetical protein [Thermoanaerobaculia bacterium]